MRNLTIIIMSLFLSTQLFASSNSKSKMNGLWKFHLKLASHQLPFIIEINQDQATLYNGQENFKLSNIEINKDQFKIPLHVFDAALEGKVTEDGLSGHWIKYYKKDYKVPFKAQRTQEKKLFSQSSDNKLPFAKKWEIYFEDKGKKTKAIGNFEVEGSLVSGSFLTSTGDYRHLRGEAKNGKLTLYGFDGGFAFAVSANYTDRFITGKISGGKTWSAKISGEVNDKAELPNPYELTYLKDKNSVLDFKLPNLKGEEVHFNSKENQKKVRIIQIFGTWCPNCLDESKYLAQWYKDNKDKNIEIFCMAFERAPSMKYAIMRLKKFRKETGLEYPIVLADIDGSKKPIHFFPQLNHVMSFPTTIIVDQKNKVRKIHTGFSGPGTGAYFEKFKRDFESFMKELL